MFAAAADALPQLEVLTLLTCQMRIRAQATTKYTAWARRRGSKLNTVLQFCFQCIALQAVERKMTVIKSPLVQHPCYSNKSHL